MECNQVTEDPHPPRRRAAPGRGREAIRAAWRGPLLAKGAAVWYWSLKRRGWQSATVTGWSSLSSYPVYDVELSDGLERWGWIWQVIPRGADDLPPTDPPGALLGELGPWP